MELFHLYPEGGQAPPVDFLHMRVSPWYQFRSCPKNWVHHRATLIPTSKSTWLDSVMEPPRTGASYEFSPWMVMMFT